MFPPTKGMIHISQPRLSQRKINGDAQFDHNKCDRVFIYWHSPTEHPNPIIIRMVRSVVSKSHLPCFLDRLVLELVPLDGLHRNSRRRRLFNGNFAVSPKTLPSRRISCSAESSFFFLAKKPWLLLCMLQNCCSSSFPPSGFGDMAAAVRWLLPL